jgi:hypothetical protein
MDQSKTKLGVTSEFLSQMGRFHGIWSSIELNIDYAVGKFLGVPHEEAHFITAGTDFNRKVRLLQALVKRKNPPRSNDIVNALSTIQNESLRNAFAHSCLTGDENTVTFVERSRYGRYDPKQHDFTMPQFEQHVEKLYFAGDQLFVALGEPSEELQEFADCALTAHQPTS